MFDDPVDATLANELVNAAPGTYQWNTFHDRNAQLENAFSADKGWRLLDGESDAWTLVFLILSRVTARSLALPSMLFGTVRSMKW